MYQDVKAIHDLHIDLTRAFPEPGSSGSGLRNVVQNRFLITILREQLLLMLHAGKCQQSPKAESPQCSLYHCTGAKAVLNHMMACQAGEDCAVPRCKSAKKALNHWNNCKKTDCPVCQPIRNMDQSKIINPAPFGSGYLRAALPTPGPPRGTSNTVALTAPEMRNPVVEVIGNSIYLLPGPPAISNATNSPVQIQQFQNKWQTRAIPISGMKEWHQHMARDFRDHLVYKLVQAMATPNLTSMPDKRMSDVVEYAQMVEADLYKMANSRAEYYQLFEEMACKIKKGLEEKRQKQMKTSKI